MRRICVSSAVRPRQPRRRGTAAGTSSPRRPKRCGEFSWTRRGTSAPRKPAATGTGSRLADIEPAIAEPDVDLLALHDALDKLEAADKRKAELVKLRFFVGLTIEEAAQALGVSISTADD